MSKTILLSNRVIAEKAQHLEALAAATLPDTQSENLVALHLSRLAPAIKARQKRMRELEEARQRYVALSEDERTERLNDWIQLQRDINAVWEELVEIPAPKRKLTDANFPQKLKKASGLLQIDGNTTVLDGAANARSNAAAKAALAPEYYEFVDEEQGATQSESED